MAGTEATGVTREYLGVPVYEGVYAYRGMSIVPAWGGILFEALMPDLFVLESTWGSWSWVINHPAMVRAEGARFPGGRPRLLGVLAGSGLG